MYFLGCLLSLSTDIMSAKSVNIGGHCIRGICVRSTSIIASLHIRYLSVRNACGGSAFAYANGACTDGAYIGVVKVSNARIKDADICEKNNDGSCFWDWWRRYKYGNSFDELRYNGSTLDCCTEIRDLMPWSYYISSCLLPCQCYNQR